MDWDELAREAAAALTRFDAEALAALCDEDVAIRPMRAAFEDTVYHGHAGVERFIRESHETWSELSMDVHGLEPEGDRALLRGTLRGRSVSGLPLDIELAWIVRVLDGKILNLRTYVDPDEARADFRASAAG